MPINYGLHIPKTQPGRRDYCWQCMMLWPCEAALEARVDALQAALRELYDACEPQVICVACGWVAAHGVRVHKPRCAMTAAQTLLAELEAPVAGFGSIPDLTGDETTEAYLRRTRGVE